MLLYSSKYAACFCACVAGALPLPEGGVKKPPLGSFQISNIKVCAGHRPRKCAPMRCTSAPHAPMSRGGDVMPFYAVAVWLAFAASQDGIKLTSKSGSIPMDRWKSTNQSVFAFALLWRRLLLRATCSYM